MGSAEIPIIAMGSMGAVGERALKGRSLFSVSLHQHSQVAGRTRFGEAV
jgi:hypothetical protein